MKKKSLRALLVAALCVGLWICGTQAERKNKEAVKKQQEEKTLDAAEKEEKENKTPQQEENEPDPGWIGVILNGDETEDYTLAHIDGIRQAAAHVGITPEEILWKERVGAGDSCRSAVRDLIKKGCRLIIANSESYGETIREEAEKNPEVRFVAVRASQSGQDETESGQSNFYQVHMNTYEASYVAGIAAGMKAARLDKKKKLPDKSYDADGNIKLGYIAAKKNEDARADINAYYRGVKAVCKNAALQVVYTGYWNNSDAEATVAGDLIRGGCVVIAGNTDLHAGVQMVENARKTGKYVFAVGRNTDLHKVAKQAALTSVVSVWSTYYTQLFEAVQKEEPLEPDWNGGYETGAVTVTALGKSAAPKTVAKVRRIEKNIKAGKKQIPYVPTQIPHGITEYEKNAEG